MHKMKRETVIPRKPKFHKRYVDDIYVRRPKRKPDEFFNALNTYHPNVKLTIEENPKKFLDTSIIRNEDGRNTYRVHRNDSKLPFHWSSEVPTQYKRSVIKGELSRAKRISSSFQEELRRIREKFKAAGYPSKFIEAQINAFQRPDSTDEMIIPKWLFEEPRKKVFIKVPFCQKNEKAIKKIVTNIENFTNGEIDVVYTWKTTKVRSLFPLKDKVSHNSRIIYKGECSCNMIYIGETKRNATIRWNEHNSNNEKSEPSKHLVQNPETLT